MIDSISPDEDLKRILEYRTQELIDYQNLSFAKEYMSFIGNIFDKEKKLDQAQNYLKMLQNIYLS